MRLWMRGLGAGFSAQTTPITVRAPSGTATTSPGASVDAVGNPIGIGVVESDRHQDIDDGLGHAKGLADSGRLRKGEGSLRILAIAARPPSASRLGRLCRLARSDDGSSPVILRCEAARRAEQVATVPKPKSDDAFPYAARDVAAEVGRWLSHLGSERRMSAKTLDAYERDVRQFLSFLAEHLGGPPSLADLAKLAPQDVRAFMAARRGRRLGRPLADAGARRRALVRALSGTQRQGQSGRARRGARAEGAEDPAEAARHRVGQADVRRRSARRRGARAVGDRARRRGAGAALWLGAAHRRSARRSRRRGHAGARRATSSPSPARATSSAWCRCCRRSRS